jgi:hypothetical protein
MIIKTDQQSLKYIQDQRLVEGVQHMLLINYWDIIIRWSTKKAERIK